MKKLMLAGLIALGAFGVAQVPTATAQQVDCSLVRCEACPAGYELAPTGNDCCRCKKI